MINSRKSLEANMLNLQQPINPVDVRGYNDVSFNPHTLKTFCEEMNRNMGSITHMLQDLQNQIIRHKEFSDWVDKFSPEARKAFNAHKNVMLTFDSADDGPVAYAEAGPA
jgi:hypothetical protein